MSPGAFDLDAAAKDFARAGAVRLPGILGPEAVSRLADAVEANLAAPGPQAKVASEAGDPGLFIEDFRRWRDFDGYRSAIFDSPLGETAARLMGSATARLHHDHMLTKAARTRQPTPWHQDQPYYNIDGRMTCSLWIPLDPTPRAASLKFLAGSHLGPWLTPRTFRTGEALWFPEGALTELGAIADDDPRILAWDLEPGDAVAFHMLTVHAAGGSERRRRAFSVRFIGDDATFAPRPWATSPAFPGLDGALAAGGPFDHPDFPVVWPRRP